MKIATQPKSNGQRQVSRETLCYNIVELLKLANARAEDIQQLRSLSDRISHRVKLPFLTAEKTINEVVYREDIRCNKEMALIQSYCNQIVDKALLKKQEILRQIEKNMLKILKVVLSCEQVRKTSEFHLQAIMNTKIGSDSLFSSQSEKIRRLQSFSYGITKEQYSRSSKVFEACLYGKDVNIYLLLCFLFNISRKTIADEINRQRKALENGPSSSYPTISIFVTTKKQSCPTKPLQPFNRKNLSIRNEDIQQNLVQLYREFNSDIFKGIQRFSGKMRRPIEMNNSKGVELVEKWERALRYENIPFIRLHCPLFKFINNINNEYFSDTVDLATRIHMINASIQIKRAFRQNFLARRNKAASIIQASWRGFKIRCRDYYYKLSSFRTCYYRLKLRF